MMNETMRFGRLRRNREFGCGVLAVLLSLALAGCAVRSGQPLPPLPTIGGVGALYWHGYTSYTAPWVDSYTAKHGQLGWLVGLCDDRPVVLADVRMSVSRSGEAGGDLVGVRVKDLFYAQFLHSQDGQGLSPMPTRMAVSSRDELIQRAIGVLLRHGTPATRDTNTGAINGDGSDQRGTGDHARPTNHRNGAITQQRSRGGVADRYKVLLDAIYNASDPFQAVSIQNNNVEVTSDSVLRVAEEGLPIMPYVLARMRDPATSFNEFVRYYTAVGIILAQHGKSGDTGWTGGARMVSGPGHANVEPGSVPFDQAFRDRVCGRLEMMYRDLLSTCPPQARGIGYHQGERAP